MKKDERIALKIRADREQMKLLEKMNKGRHYSYDVENLINDGKDFIEATRRGTLMCVIKSVSASGMSRVMNFNSCEKNKSKKAYWYRQYWGLFEALGYTESRNGNGFTIDGCGMNMVFDTHYTIIHTLHRLGFIDRKECDKLAQQTPTTF